MANLPTKNNNPGDLRFVGQDNASPGSGGFASFKNPEEGHAALLNDIQAKINKHPDWTLGDFSNTYAPPSDNNNTAQYTANLANFLKVSPDTKIKSLESRIGNFADAISKNEGYQGAHGTQGASDSFIPTAEAAGGPSTSQPDNSGSSFLDKALGLISGQTLPGLFGFSGGNFSQTPPIPPDVTLPVAGGYALGGLVGAVAGPEIAGAVESGSGGNILGNLTKGLGIDKLLGGGNNTPTEIPTPSESPAQPDVLKELSDLNSQIPEAHKNSQTLSENIAKAYASTPTGRSALQSDKGVQGGVETIGKYGLAPETDEYGSMDFTGASSKAKSFISDLSENTANALESEGVRVPVQYAISNAKQQIRDFAPSSEWEDADKYIEKRAADYVKNFGDKEGTLSLGSYQRMKQEMSYGKKYGLLETSASKNADKALAAGARKTIEDHTKNPDLYNAVMKEESRLINARKVMKKLQGKRAPQNDNLIKGLIHLGGRYAAIYIGDKIGGPIGAILGELVGQHVTRAIDKKFGKTIFETPQMHTLLDALHKAQPTVYKRLIMELKKHQIKVVDKDNMPGSAFPKSLLVSAPKSVINEKGNNNQSDKGNNPSSQNSPNKNSGS